MGIFSSTLTPQVGFSTEQAFAHFQARIRPQPWDISLAVGHRDSIRKKLEASLGVLDFVPTGSMGNGTALSGADVDYFAVIPIQNLKADSKASLDEIAEAMRHRFPRTTGIRVNRPGVYVPFGIDNLEPTEVIPAAMTGRTLLGYRAFLIPDDDGAWKFSAPESHKAWVADVDRLKGGRLKPLIQFAKAWAKYRNVPIKSLYLELTATKYALSQDFILYDWGIRDILTAMLSEGLRPLLDPRFPLDQEFIQPCTCLSNWLDAYSKLSRAANWAQQAIDAKLQGDGGAAIDRWDLVFGGHFSQPPLP